MNKRIIISSLNEIADTLDISGLYREAKTITDVMVKIADEFDTREDFDDKPPANETKTKPSIKSKSQSKESAVLKKILAEFERKVDDICSNSKDAKDAMILMSNVYYRGLINIIDNSPKERLKFGNRAMEMMNDCLKKYNLE